MNKIIISIITICIVIFLLLPGCCNNLVALQVTTRKAEHVELMTQYGGINLKGSSDEALFLRSSYSTTIGELFDVIDQWEDFSLKKDTKKTQVYIDVSAGLRYGIKASKDHMKKLTLTLENDVEYFKVNDNGVEAFEITDYLKAYETFLLPINFKNRTSPLNLGLDKCIENHENVSVFITDFLLDDGTAARRPDAPFPQEITENPTPWAISEFKSWFEKDNILEIVAVEHSIPSTLYGCKGNNARKDCSKYLYYMFFTPKELVGKNEAINTIIDEIKDFENTLYFKIDPLAFKFDNSDISSVGSVDFSYKSSKQFKPNTIKPYNVQFIPYNMKLLKQTLDTEQYTDLMIINNLKKNDRNTKVEFPYKIDVNAKFYDVTDFYYQFASIDKMFLENKLPIDDYPENIIDEDCEGAVKVVGPREKESEGIFIFNPNNNSISITSTALMNNSYMKGEPGKLFLCDIYVEKSDFEAYENDILNWTFYSRHGELPNNSLKESINSALEANRSKIKNRIIYSYLIAINDPQNK